MIEAKIVADSISQEGKRLTTMQLRYPRFIHAEFMTHRLFSRNASSSRAIPVKKLIEDLRREPAMPVFWGSNKPGMQAGDELDAQSRVACKTVWLKGMEQAIETAEHLMQIGLHKQIANRVLEPWAHINVVVTATEWQNFFDLRCHPDAQPEMQALAVVMVGRLEASMPMPLGVGEWHLPYVEFSDATWPDVQTAVKVSVARCARVSYLTHEGQPPNPEDDLKLYERLVGSRPLHASPAEHQATPDKQCDTETWPYRRWENQDEHGNFVGWRQFRKQLEKQHVI